MGLEKPRKRLMCMLLEQQRKLVGMIPHRVPCLPRGPHGEAFSIQAVLPPSLVFSSFPFNGIDTSVFMFCEYEYKCARIKVWKMAILRPNSCLVLHALSIILHCLFILLFFCLSFQTYFPIALFSDEQ